MENYSIKFNGKSLNSDRSNVLKSWDKSEVGMLRVVVNEIIHTMTTGDYRGLQTVLSHVSGRTAVYSTCVEVIKASVGRSVLIKDNETGGFVMSVAKEKTRAFNDDVTQTLILARDTGTVGLFNNDLLKMIGVATAKAAKAFDFKSFVNSIASKAKKNDVTLLQLTEALEAAFKAEEAKLGLIPAGRPQFDKNMGVRIAS